MSVVRRQELLSQLAEEVMTARVTDYQEMGADGVWNNVGPDSKNTLAIRSLRSRTEISGEGAGSSTVVSDIAMEPRETGIAAIKELNAMTGAYPAEKQPSPLVALIANGIVIETNIVRDRKK